MKVKRFVKEFKPIEIKEPFKTDIIEFVDPKDFTKYYREHEDEFMNMSTYKLNMRYKIPGYKISQPRNKGKDESGTTDEKNELKLVKDYRGNTYNEDSRKYLTDSPEGLELLRSEIMAKYEDLEKRISNIEAYLSNQ